MSRDEELFADARALPLAERAAFLDRACAGDVAQRARLEELLAGISEGERLMPATHAPRGLISAEEKPSDWIGLPAAGSARAGRYKLLEKLGEGGCGAVWMAQQEEPVRRRVALKIIKLGMDTKEVIARFEAERQALALMDHPNIAKVFDAGTTVTGRPFFVMELVRGVPITEFCDAKGLTIEQRLALFITVCDAIQHAHQKGIVHRDIKPSNILVTQHDVTAAPKVIDFGIAKATHGRLTDATLFTAFQQFIGTPAYMSPEQAEFNAVEVDTRSDVYSLGVLLYELLTGRPPFDPKTLLAAGIDEIRRIIREVEPPRPSTRLGTLSLEESTQFATRRGSAVAQISRQLSGDLDWVVMRCLEKDRTRRYATASDLALDLQRHLRHDPVVARPPSFSYRLGKFIRRRRVPVAAAAVLTLAAALGATSLWQARRAERAEKTAAQLAFTATLSPKAIAVLPFENLSEDREANAFFVDGMHEDVIAGLTRIPDLRCVPRPTVAAYRDAKKPLRELAGELQVAYVLTGSVRRSGQKVRLTATLVDARTAAPRWSRTYDRELADVFAIQAELAQAIAAELKAVISPEVRQELERRPTENLTAYDLYLKAREIAHGGLQLFQRQKNWGYRVSSYLQDQESLLRSAVILDPDFAAAWAQLARVHSNTFHGAESTYKDRSETRRVNARAAIDKALSLASEDTEVILARGFFLQYCERDYAGAAESFETVMRRQPNDSAPFFALGQLRRAQARWTEALELLRRATVLDPANTVASAELRVLLAAARRYDETEAERRRIATLQKGVRPHEARALFFAKGDTRDMDALLEGNPNYGQLQFQRFAHHHEKYVPALLEYFRTANNRPQPPGPTAAIIWDNSLHYAVLLSATGQAAEARRWLEHAPANLRARLALEPDNTTLLCDLGCAEALLGNPEEALRAVRRAMELIPYALDAWQAPQVEENLAFVYAWTGDKTRAIETYAKLLRMPHVSPRQAACSVHVMRHALWYSPLRGDPRWEALLADPKNNAPLF